MFGRSCFLKMEFPEVIAQLGRELDFKTYFAKRCDYVNPLFCLVLELKDTVEKS